LYHCYLGEMLRTGCRGRITSTRIAEDLGIKQETVRRDLSFIGAEGRPGAGYVARKLFDVLQSFLALRDEHPIITVGSVQMLEALAVVFPMHSYGLASVAYYSEHPADAGVELHGVEVRHISEIPELDAGLGATVALVACASEFVQLALDKLAEAGTVGVLLLTPALGLKHPDGMLVTHIRMPCDLKSLACMSAAGVGDG
jgi:redox-sensing transcriptional repressor